jgi:hypothetical protein
LQGEAAAAAATAGSVVDLTYLKYKCILNNYRFPPPINMMNL